MIIGQLGHFTFQTLLIQLTTSLALMKVATTVVDLIAINVLPAYDSHLFFSLPLSPSPYPSPVPPYPSPIPPPYITHSKILYRKAKYEKTEDFSELKLRQSRMDRLGSTEMLEARGRGGEEKREGEISIPGAIVCRSPPSPFSPLPSPLSSPLSPLPSANVSNRTLRALSEQQPCKHCNKINRLRMNKEILRLPTTIKLLKIDKTFLRKS